jgi:hypothetical protein
MKSKRFEYAVFSGSMMLAGHFSFDRPVSIEQASWQAAQIAEDLARECEMRFDGQNVSVAVRPTKAKLHAPQQ